MRVPQHKYNFKDWVLRRRDEVCLIFDRYDIEMSLKEATREKRQ